VPNTPCPHRWVDVTTFGDSFTRLLCRLCGAGRSEPPVAIQSNEVLAGELPAAFRLVRVATRTQVGGLVVGPGGRVLGVALEAGRAGDVIRVRVQGVDAATVATEPPRFAYYGPSPGGIYAGGSQWVTAERADPPPRPRPVTPVRGVRRIVLEDK